MEKWEYMVLEQPAGVLGFVDRQTHEQYPGSLSSVLNAVGAEAWQVMSYDTLPDGRAVLILGRKPGAHGG
ncbi:MAG TPA: hypothetical protein VGM37_16385 [Armatimonadota bacterium]|jgi:hypothetical protein